jgi:putative ABC transport system permease protein
LHLGESVRIGLKGLMSHKLRSFLTMLGVVFGVAAVIAMVSIGEGARSEAVEQIKLLGANNIRVKPVELHGKNLEDARRKNVRGIEVDDAHAIAELCPEVEAVAGLAEVKQKVRAGAKTPEATVMGVEPVYLDVSDAKVRDGRFINVEDLTYGAKVCVLGEELKRELFSFDDALNKTIKIGDIWFTVVGIMQRKGKGREGKTVIEIRNLDRDVYIPMSTAFARFAHSPGQPLSEISIKVKEARFLRSSAALMQRILLRRHQEVEDFEIVVPEELLRQSQQTQHIFNVVMGCIAGIALLVGGIGIMNIMLATVTQRTREIGIRRSLGACRRDILEQFLIECVTLSMTGGIMGVLLGLGLSRSITFYAKWSTIVSPGVVVLSFGVSVMTGIVFGLYPATKAAQLDPVEALRYE